MGAPSLRSDLVLILDFGSQYTQLIARRIRESSVYCEIPPLHHAARRARGHEAARHHPLGRPGERLRRGRAHRRPERSSSSASPSSASATACSSWRTCSAARSSAPTRASTARPTCASTKPVGIFAGFADGRDARRVDEPRRPHQRAAAGFRDHRHDATTRRSARSRTTRAQDLRRAVPPRGGAHAARRRDPSRRSSSTSPASRRRGRPASFTDEAIRIVREKVGPSEQRDLRPLGRRRLVGRGRALPPRARRPAHVHLRRQRPAPRGRARAGRAHSSARRFHLNLDRTSTRASASSTRSHGVTDPGAEAQDHRQASSSTSSRTRPHKVEGARFLVQGTLYPDVIESVSFKGAERGHQEPPQRRRPARAHEAEAHRAAARALQGRGARRGRGPRHAARHPLAPAVPGPGPRRSAASARSPSRASPSCARPTPSSTKRSRALGPLRAALAELLRAPAGASVGVMGDERTYDETCAIRAVHSHRRHDRRLGAPPATTSSAKLSNAHHQRGARHQPRRLRHLVQAARRPSSGSEPPRRARARPRSGRSGRALRRRGRGVSDPPADREPPHRVPPHEGQRGRGAGHHRRHRPRRPWATWPRMGSLSRSASTASPSSTAGISPGTDW